MNALKIIVLSFDCNSDCISVSVKYRSGTWCERMDYSGLTRRGRRVGRCKTVSEDHDQLLKHMDGEQRKKTLKFTGVPGMGPDTIRPLLMPT